jgi:hypothetical protein
MKFIILLFTLIFFIVTNYAQTFPANGWQQGVYYAGNFYNSPPDHPRSVYYVNDTVLCGLTYSIICQMPSWPGPGTCGTQYFVRKQGGQIYVGGYCGYADKLLYDFNLVANDTLTLTFGYGHTGLYEVDTTYNILLLNNSTRKYIELRGIDNWNSADTLRWIEDIGDIDNGFFTEGDFEGGHSNFICHKENGQLLWENYHNSQTLNSCDSVTDIALTTDNRRKENAINIFPNPFTDAVNVSNRGSRKLSFEVYDVTMRKVSLENFESDIVLDLSILESGIYFYVVRDHSTVIQSGKLIKC